MITVLLYGLGAAVIAHRWFGVEPALLLVTPPSKVLSVLQDVLLQVAGLASDPAPVARLAGQEDLALRYEVRYWVASHDDHPRVESEILRLAWYHFRRQGVDAPARSANPGDAGAPGDSFFVIDSGEVQLSRRTGGFSRELARLMDGQFFGEMALLTGEPRAATVVAASDVDLFVLDKNGFQDIIAANPAIAVDNSSILAERREALNQAEGDVTHRFDVQGNPTELKARILHRIRAHFGV